MAAGFNPAGLVLVLVLVLVQCSAVCRGLPATPPVALKWGLAARFLMQRSPGLLGQSWASFTTTCWQGVRASCLGTKPGQGCLSVFFLEGFVALLANERQGHDDQQDDGDDQQRGRQGAGDEHAPVAA